MILLKEALRKKDMNKILSIEIDYIFYNENEKLKKIKPHYKKQ